MDQLTALLMTIDAVAQTSASAMAALAQRLLTIAVAALLIGGVTVFALSGFAWLWLKRMVEELPHLPTAARP